MELNGIVADASGAAVPGAVVKAINIDTGYTQSAKSSSSGIELDSSYVRVWKSVKAIFRLKPGSTNGRGWSLRTL